MQKSKKDDPKAAANTAKVLKRLRKFRERLSADCKFDCLANDCNE
jgi:hypothetical protein